ncbi:uncharacterized protein LOC141837018 [Curcuma longa]|uniref:uncharacterized protein LOC141837018 n=1 Tax=Curcuma longa TaxID=136217 RepID=UPI003D9DE783
MTTRLKKNRKKRGHVSTGHGRIGKHQKHPGGRGNAGGMHHHRILFDKYHPGYFGKVGMRYFHRLRNKFHCPIVNVHTLWSLVPEDVKDAAAKGASAPLIDVTQFGYFKVLGKGSLPPSRPIVVKAKLVSKIAEKNIKAAGGAVLLTASSRPLSLIISIILFPYALLPEENPSAGPLACRCSKKKEANFADQLLDYIEGGPKLRKWYGAPDLLPKHVDLKDEDESLEIEEIRDTVLVTDGESEIGQMVILSLILKCVQIKAIVKDKRAAASAFGTYVERTKNCSALCKAMENLTEEQIIAAHKMTREDVAEMKEKFNFFDKDGDGILSPHSRIFWVGETDVDQNGTIEFSEFLNVMARKNKGGDSEEELMAAFKEFEMDSNEFISAEESASVSLIRSLNSSSVRLRPKDLITSPNFVEVMWPRRRKRFITLPDSEDAGERRLYGAPDLLPKDGDLEDEDESSEIEEIRDAMLVTDGESEIGQMVILSLILKRVRIKAIVKDKRAAASAFGTYVESLVGDLNDKTFLTKTLRGVRAIICASNIDLKVFDSLILQLAYYNGSGGFQAIMNSKAGKLSDRDETAVITAGVPYTIIKTGLLQSVPSGDQGFSFSKGDAAKGSLSKEDAAVICVEALESPPEEGLIFEVVNGEEKVTDWKVKFAALIEGTVASQ